MFGFIKKCFFTAMTFLSCNALNAIPLKCVLMNNQECKVRPEILTIDSNEPSFYPVGVVIILMIHMLNYAFLML